MKIKREYVITAAIIIVGAILGWLSYVFPVAAQAPAGFSLLANVSTASYSDSTCPNQSTCYYEVTAVDSTGHESPPAACAATQLCFGGNQAVAVMPSSGTHTVGLVWLPSGTAGVTYNVYRHIGPLGASGLTATVN